MADKRLIYFTAQRVTAYAWSSGRLEAEGVFAANDEGVAEFAGYVAGNPKSLYYMLADVVEEDFVQENIPAVRGKDRALVLQRKIAQRYRDSTLAAALSLGITQVGGRREESILFASFTNTLPFQPWLSVLRSHDVRLVGVFSSPLVAPLLAKRIAFKAGTFLVVSVSTAGLRQSFVENGQIRLSRLGHADTADPRALAQLCAQESARMQQYLVNLRILPRDAGALEVLMLAPQGQKALFQESCRDSANIQFHIHAIDELYKPAGLKEAPADAGAEALFLHTLAAVQPAVQFASADLRRFYNIWRARLAILGSGAATCMFCLMLAGLKLGQGYLERSAADASRAEEMSASQQYASLQANFPKTPTDSSKLGVIVKNYQALLGRKETPEPFLVDLSNALASVPQVEMEQITWSASDTSTPAAKNPGDSVPLQQSATLAGRINVPQSNDYRAITQIIDQFAEALRRQPGVEVVSRRLPFDVNAESHLAGDIGTARAAEVPRFTIVVSRKAPSS